MERQNAQLLQQEKSSKEIDEEWKTKVFKFEPHKTIKDLQLLDIVTTLEIKATVEKLRWN